MERHTCKLCSRRFTNGRALGGHMRSHAVAAAAAHSSASSAASADGDDDDQPHLSYVLRENPRKSFKLVDPEFSSFPAAMEAGSSSIVQDHESDTESPLAPWQRRRSKRPRRDRQPPPTPEPLSSVSDTTPEEDVAVSLMMLSRDVWIRFVDSDDGAARDPEAAQPRRSGRYQCETCKKVFKSYQALGGHRASHKKLKQSCATAHLNFSPSSSATAAANAGRAHECDVCLRVFGSGQALGGHRRSHLCCSPDLAAPSPPLPRRTGFIDLNLPAPVEDDAAELSIVSDSEIH